MTKYKLEIKETLSRVVDVDADSLEEAIETLEEMHTNETIVLGAEDFVGYEIEVL